MAPSTASRMSSRLPTLSALSILARTPMEAPAQKSFLLHGSELLEEVASPEPAH